VPLSLAYPQAEIPVLQVSVQGHLGSVHHLRLGQALAPLREEGVLVLGSGSWTHDLRRFHDQAVDAPAAADVVEFADWMDRALAEGRHADLLAYREKAPHAALEHPTEEHLLPLFVAIGVVGEGAKPERIHESAMYGILRMDAYAFR
jgi:4,5-DOPA dioxygenase extradiol